MQSSCDILDDIEDILKQDSLNNLTNEDFNRTNNKSFILPKNLKYKQSLQTDEDQENIQPDENSNVPGLASIYVKTWGCTHNGSDGEYMAGQLAAYGYKLVDEPAQADLWLLNSCTVKNPAEDHFKNYIDKARETNKHIVLAGCVPQGAPKSAYMKGLSVIGVQQIDRIVEVVEETLKGNNVRLMGKKRKNNKKYGGASLNLPKVRRNPLIEIIAINTGCLNECTYCKTKHARGELGSYNPDEIVERLKQSFAEGVVEIWLTSEDTGAYGRDIGTNIVELLWKMVEHIPEGCMLRIGMTNPPYILEHLEQMALILDHPRVYSFLHVPIQSASDSVLADMKREYCSDDFRDIVNFLREKVPGVNILTDLILGFPTETEEDFQETIKLVEDYKFSSLFINQFFQRPGTPAARMRQVPTQERKRRTRIVSELFNSYTTFDKKLGERQHVLVTEVSHDGNFYVAHNKFYEQVLVPKVDIYMGKMIEVEIIECTKFSMKGNVVEQVFNTPLRPVEYKQGEVTGVKTDSNNNESGCCGGFDTKTSGSCGSGNVCCNDNSDLKPSLKWTTPESNELEDEEEEEGNNDKLRQDRKSVV